MRVHSRNAWLPLLLLLGGAVAAAEPMGSGSATAPAMSGDTRAPLPLTAMMAAHQKQNMRDHLAAIQEIVGALGRDDMEGVAKAARRLGYSDAMAQMCDHMGAAAPGFSEVALSFHRTADGIGAAAARGDRAGVLSALNGTLQTCVGCHAAYRQEVVDEETWRRLAASAAHPGPP